MGRGEYGGGNAMAAAATGLPGWLSRLVEESFFVGCGAHESRKKNEKNIFCLDCCTSICPHCAPAHSSHPLLQVRRYVYNDVVRLDDLEKLIDCSYVQVEHVLLQGEDLSSILFRFNESDFAFSHFENLRMDSSDLIDDDGQVTTPSSILEDPVQYHGCSASSNSGKQGGGSEAPKKKKKSGSFFPQIVLSLSNRRKGAPHRSPLS
ncbi:hypothetical protein BHE74_00013271 [Ensete ventricosum]|nr:hypothetical protein GW17_00009876 [Ensete ventricosum]RWW78503.1 hypothetical protein BHE74_00013271 [Ensete ventricosum]RZR75650.1 hypothetical protein BHM03_00000128 [Ensete ventricosum]